MQNGKTMRWVGAQRRVFLVHRNVIPAETVVPVLYSNTPYDAAPKNGAAEGDKVAKKLCSLVHK